MELISSFEDIKAFQEARAFNVEIYKTTNQEVINKDFDLKRQIRRASVSIVSILQRVLSDILIKNLFIFYISQKVVQEKLELNYFY